MSDQSVSVKQEYACNDDALAACWLTRLGLYQEAYLSQIMTGRHAEELCRLIRITLPKKSSSSAALRTKLKLRLAAFNKNPPDDQTELFVNTRLLGELLQLNAVELRLLEFVTLCHRQRTLHKMMDEIVFQRTEDLFAMLAAAIDCSVFEVRGALDRKSTLMQVKLLYFDRSSYVGGLRLYTSDHLDEILLTSHQDMNDLVRQFIEPSTPAGLTAKDYPHLEKEIDLLTEYLSSVIKHPTSGANVLLYGPPGVGKTELVRLLAKKIGTPLYQVKSSEDNAEVIGGFARLMSFSLSQRILRQTDALILFDEMEDIFAGTTGHDRVRYGQNNSVSKAWMNSLLETNPVPTIWVSNDVSNVDPAYLRRFDLSFEIGVPPLSVRKRIIKKHLNGLRLPSSTIDKCAQNEELSPAQFQKAAKVSRIIADRGGNGEETFEHVLENSMALLQQTTQSNTMDLSSAHYRLDCLNADCDLPRLVEQLSQAEKPCGAICFYGAPGTGKSALAHYLSQTSERPLLVRRASDILSPYVGVAEQKIAQMFKQAEQEQSILLLDEADSFLADRKSAKASWEVTQVNEMLTQMESFKGLFICSTNLMTRLDEASLRRFALKIRFDYLKPEQRWQLFQEHIGPRARIDEAHCRAKLNQMNNLTPGDFACVRRQAALLGEKLSAEKWLFHLERECRAKPDQGGRSIGFM